MAGIYALDRESGVLQWAFDVEHGVGTDLLLAGERVLAFTLTGELIALHRRTGEPAWTLAPDGRLEGDDLRQATPALGGGRVFFETHGGRLYAADIATGALVWRRELGTDITSALLMTPDGLLAGLADGRLVRLDPATGDVEAVLSVDGVPRGALVRGEGVLLVLLARGDALVAVEESLARVLGGADDILYVGTLAGRVYAYRR